MSLTELHFLDPVEVCWGNGCVHCIAINKTQHHFGTAPTKNGAKHILVSGFNLSKQKIVKLDHFSRYRGEHKNIWNHQPAYYHHETQLYSTQFIFKVGSCLTNKNHCQWQWGRWSLSNLHPWNTISHRLQTWSDKGSWLENGQWMKMRGTCISYSKTDIFRL